MSTTTIRIPDPLKLSLKRAAARAGTTPHNFILEAIAEKTELMASRQDFEKTANRRYAEIVASGKTIPWNEMRRYLDTRSRGRMMARPAARKLA